MFIYKLLSFQIYYTNINLSLFMTNFKTEFLFPRDKIETVDLSTVVTVLRAILTQIVAYIIIY